MHDGPGCSDDRTKCDDAYYCWRFGIADATGGRIAQKTNLSVAIFLTDPSISLRDVQIRSAHNVDHKHRRGTRDSDVSGSDTARTHPDGSRHGGLPGVVQILRCRGRFAGQQRAASEGRRAGLLRRGTRRRSDQAAGSESRRTAGAGVAKGSQDIGCPQGLASKRGTGRKLDPAELDEETRSRAAGGVVAYSESAFTPAVRSPHG